MAFGARIQRSLTLARRSLTLLSRNPSLLVLPLISGLALLLVIGSFVAPILMSDELRTMLDGQSPDTEYADYAYGFLFYLVAFTAMNFFNAALVFCILARLRGEPASVAEGLRMALKRFPQIFAWSLLSATLGLVLKVLRDRAGFAGQVVAGLAGIAWSIATYFVVPVLVTRGVGPLEALRESAATLRRVWGESLVANLGLNLIVVLATLVLAAIAASAFAVLPQEAAIGVLTLAVVAFGAVSLVVATLSAILQATLYAYATNGTVPAGFDRSDLESAFHRRHLEG